MLFIIIPFERTFITFQTPPMPHGPWASLMQVSNKEVACSCTQPMANNADTASRQVDISLVAIVLFWRSEPGFRFLYSYSSRDTSRCPPLLSLTSLPETAVLRKRPPKTLLGRPPKRTTFYMQWRLRKSTKCVQSPFYAFYGGFEQNSRSTETPVAEPQYVTFEGQNLLRNKNR